MLKEHGVDVTYREYTQDPLTVDELRDVFRKLGMKPAEMLRKRDAKPLGVTGKEGDEALLALMAEHPTLLQRPIGIVGDKAASGRPIENLLTLVS